MQDIEMLHHIHKSTEMGREGILSVLGSAKDTALRTALEQQLTEYEQMMGSSARAGWRSGAKHRKGSRQPQSCPPG